MATPAEDVNDRYDQTNQLARFDHFVADQHDDKPPLTPFEVAKLDDLRDDVVWLQERDHAERTSWLAREYARFERWWGRPGDPRHGLVAATTPAPAEPPPGPFDAECQLLDRLSVWYGGRYRGVIIFNYRNALMGGAAALAGHTMGGVFEFMFGIVEILCFLAILGFYFVGRTPQPAFRGTSRARPPLARRWHQRWIEYRVLAERFRYAALLAPLSEPLDVAWSRLMGEVGTPNTWHDRYFLWRVRRAPPTKVMDARWIERLLKIMDYQVWYHTEAGARRHNVVHRLHRLAMTSFVLGVALLTLRVLLVAWEHRVFGETHHGEAILFFALVVSFVGGFFTILAASVQGMLSTAELARLASGSQDTAQRITTLRNIVDAKRAAGATPADLRVELQAFCRLVTEEASGWRALLRDKDVPVPH